LAISLEDNATLKHLNIGKVNKNVGNNKLGDEGAKIIASSLSKNKTLTELLLCKL